MCETRKTEQEPEELRTLWIDHENRIISFQKRKGFRGLRFPTRGAMLAYAMEKGSNGYRIQ